MAALRDAIYACGYRDGLDVPEGPGLGVDCNWGFVARNRTGFVEYK